MELIALTGDQILVANCCQIQKTSTNHPSEHKTYHTLWANPAPGISNELVKLMEYETEEALNNVFMGLSELFSSTNRVVSQAILDFRGEELSVTLLG